MKSRWKDGLRRICDTVESFAEHFEGKSGDRAAFLLVLVFTLPSTLPSLQGYFTFDDLQNLHYYLQKPVESVLGNVLLFTSARRPAGALVYLPSYYLFGMNPLPLYVTGFLLFNLNLVLLFSFVLRLTRRRMIALVSVVPVGFHPHIHNVIFNFGAVYELVAFSGLMAALHAYLSYRRTGRLRWYLATLGFFWVALNAKETAVVLPAILLVYEFLYERLFRLERRAVQTRILSLVPFWGIAGLYALVKTLGEEAFWRTNPAYQLQFDLTFYRNLGAYFRELSYGRVHFDGPPLPLALALLLGLAVVSRRKDPWFGLAYAFLTLMPVLLLPRVWGLFLYLPLAGVGMYFGGVAAGLSDQAGAWLASRLTVRPAVKFLACVAVLVVFLRVSIVYSAPEIRYAREVHYFYRGRQYRSFARQLYEAYPGSGESSLLVFRNPPFEFESLERWCLNFLVTLKYGEDVRVHRIPEQKELPSRAVGRFQVVRFFDWVDGRLIEKNIGEVTGGSK